MWKQDLNLEKDQTKTRLIFVHVIWFTRKRGSENQDGLWSRLITEYIDNTIAVTLQ